MLPNRIFFQLVLFMNLFSRAGKKILSVYQMNQKSDETNHGITTPRSTIEKQVQRSVQVEGKFINPWKTNKQSLGFTELRKFFKTPDATNLPSLEELDRVLPVQKPQFEEDSPREGVSITWIGHSTILAQFDGFSVLTDPIFSHRASPVQWFGPARYRKAACDVSDLPDSLNAVVISHNHYDHLDANSVTALNEKYGSRLNWFVPMGMKNWFQGMGIKNAVEMDWWQEKSLPGNITVAFTPTQHWSKRTLWDTRESLWGSWTLIGPKNRFFFAGDTGYCPVFKEIGDVYGPFDVSAIPIGAYEPRWFMRTQHVDPEEAVLIHQDLKSRFSVGIHWGTFALAKEYFLDPPARLKATLEKLNIPCHEFITLKHGESKVFS